MALPSVASRNALKLPLPSRSHTSRTEALDGLEAFRSIHGLLRSAAKCFGLIWPHLCTWFCFILAARPGQMVVS